MRLTKDEQLAIREEVIRVFGRDALVRLFGSRVDDKDYVAVREYAVTRLGVHSPNDDLLDGK